MRTNSLRHIFYSIAALLTGCFFLAGCENSEKQIQDLTAKRQSVEEAKNVEAMLSQAGIVKAKLKSPLMLAYSGNGSATDTAYREFPKKLHVDFYDSTAIVQSWLDSKYGKYYETLNKVYLRDSVVAITIKGDTLETPELWWDQQQEKFYTDKPCQLNTKTRRIHGRKGLVASQDFSDIIFNDPEGVVQVSQDGFP